MGVKKRSERELCVITSEEGNIKNHQWDGWASAFSSETAFCTQTQ